MKDSQTATIYIPHRWRDGSPAPVEFFNQSYVSRDQSFDEFGTAFTIVRSGTTDKFIGCMCRLCYDRYRHRLKQRAEDEAAKSPYYSMLKEIRDKSVFESNLTEAP